MPDLSPVEINDTTPVSSVQFSAKIQAYFHDWGNRDPEDGYAAISTCDGNEAKQPQLSYSHVW